MGNFGLLLAKDFKIAFRSRKLWAAGLGFPLLLVVVASFSFRELGLSQEEVIARTPGILWLVFVFSSVSIVNHVSISELEARAIVRVMLSPLDLGWVFLSKIVLIACLLFVAQSLVFVFHGLFYSAPVWTIFPELLVLALLAALSLSGFGTILSMISVGSKGREIILPLMLFPLILPVIAGAVFCTQSLLAQAYLPYDSFWFLLMLGYSVISLTVSWVLFEFVLR